MMKLDAPDKQHRYHNLLDDDHANEMLEGEGAGLAARVAELEVRCARQAEELLCLRSTLADALRRLNALEGRPAPTQNRNGGYTGSSGTPTRELRLRQPSYRETAKRTSSYGSSASSLPQRRGPQHQSTGSLQSDSPASSSSLSPAPSPSPRATPAPLHHTHTHTQHTYRTDVVKSRNNSSSSNQSASPANQLTKRWNSTGDFNAQGLLPNSSTHTCQYNEEDGTMRMYLRGRPVVLYGPSEQDAFDPAKVAPPPQNKLKLEWVYGYRGKDCRSNLYLLPTGEIVYFVAAVVVLFNVEEQCQRHYTGHTDDVKCLAVHPNKLIIASGQCAGHDRHDARPHVRVWNSVSLATLAVIGAGQMERSVAAVSFSRADGGALLACVDEGPDHNISVWEWQRSDKHCLAETKCSVDTVIAAEFHPLDRNQIVTCGKNHIAFWSLDHTNMLYKRMGVFESRDKPKYVTCLGFNHNGDVLSGDSNGNIIVWGRGTNTIAKMVRGVHEGSVFSICCLKEGAIVTGGGKDGRIVMFDADMNATGTENVIEGHYGGVRVVSEGRGSQLFVGTTKNCILHGDLQLGFSPAVLGHVDEVWGLAAHPTVAQFATAGWDRLLQLWDAMSHSTVWSKDIEERAQCCAWSADGGVLAVGCLTGAWMVFHPHSRDLLAHHHDGSEPIQTIKYAPNNQMVAIGSRDNFIYVYQVDDDGARYSRLGKCLPHVRVWNSVSLATLAVIGAGQMERSVAAVSFSRADGGALLACVDEGPDHNISVWEWQRSDKHCLAETKCSVDTVIAAEFHPLDRNQIVTCGKNHIAFWSLDHTNMLYKRMGVFESRDKPKYVTCLGFNHNGDVLSGDSNGNIIVWGRGTNTIAKMVRGVHEGSVFSICCLKEGAIVTGGGKDGRIVMFDADMNATGTENVIEGHYGGVRVVSEGRGSQLFVGTTKNCILHGDLQLGFSPAVLGHVDEVWGLAAHPTVAQFATAGWDRLLQLWDAMSHSTVWSKDIEERAQCCAWSADGGVLAVGCLTGAWMVFHPHSRDLLAHHHDGSEPIQTIKYAPNNQMVAIGSRDNFIYVYQVDDDGARYSRLGKCLGHSSYITHLDWSEDSQYIRSNSGDYELLYWNATTCRQVTSSAAVRDVAWASNECAVSFSTVGVWPDNADGTDINSCTRSHDAKLAATGDDFGKVKLFAYPVRQPKSLCHQYGGHSSHVTCVRFLPDDSRLLSTGGLDTSVMQWLVD